MVTLSFEFGSAEEAAEFLRKNFTEQKAPAEATAPTKRGRKPKPLESDPPQAVAFGGSPAKAPTIDDVRAALSEILATKGTQAASDILARSGVTRVGDLKPEQYLTVIGDCANA